MPVGLESLGALGIVALGLLVARRQPGNWIATLLCWLALVTAVGAFSDSYLPEQQRRPDLLPCCRARSTRCW